ncbi:hypothetical protein [Halobaculum litoreum]|uniref:Uncharacterized protein n=1 Tax=Halobaculum litoreum TaxID=3031998 RepID=A0ABD5XQM0_9EURY|nr:hypothetical protein [Halobaculum sp. DT92]
MTPPSAPRAGTASVDAERASLAVAAAVVTTLVGLTLASVPFGDSGWLRPAYYAAIPAALVSPALPAAARGACGRGPFVAVALGVGPGVAWTLAVVVARGVSRLLGRSPTPGDAPLWAIATYFGLAGVVVAVGGYLLGRAGRSASTRLGE